MVSSAWLSENSGPGGCGLNLCVCLTPAGWGKTAARVREPSDSSAFLYTSFFCFLLKNKCSEEGQGTPYSPNQSSLKVEIKVFVLVKNTFY